MENNFTKQYRKVKLNKTNIYYFSGSGNSLSVAKNLEDNLRVNLIPIASLVRQNNISNNNDSIGFVFPIYDFKPPEIIFDFISKSESLPEKKYIFAICTYGLSPGKALLTLNEKLKSSGSHLSAGFTMAMPHSGIGSGAISSHLQSILNKKAKSQTKQIIKYIQSGKSGKIESQSFAQIVSSIRFKQMLAPFFKFLWISLFKSLEVLNFQIDHNCNGCRICAKICPVENIKMVADRPEWLDQCAGCFACLNWCPKEAISLGGYNMNIKQYHHPDIKLSEIIAR